MGLFRKKITPTEFGKEILLYADIFFLEDASKALAMRFDGFSHSSDWSIFLQNKGVTLSFQSIYCQLFRHCVIQAICTPLTEELRLAITHGAMTSFRVETPGYKFDATFGALESVYQGSYQFNKIVDPLENPEISISFLPDPYVGVLSAKYVIDSLLIPNLSDLLLSKFVRDFKHFSSAFCGSIGTAQRTANALSSRFRFA